jgi:hypothetical protein
MAVRGTTSPPRGGGRPDDLLSLDLLLIDEASVENAQL